MNNQELNLTIELLRAALEDMHDSERLEVFDSVTQNYCKSCGTILYGKMQCYCTRDE